MANVRGREGLVKIGMDDGPPETFQTIAAQREMESGPEVDPEDVTTKDSAQGFTAWDFNSPPKNFPVQVGGILLDADTAQTRLKEVARSTTDRTANFKLLDGTGNEWSGRFGVENYRESHPVQGVATWTCSLRNAGDVIYQPES